MELIQFDAHLSMRARIVRLAIAWPMDALGIALLLRAKLGVAPFDVMNTGVSKVTGMAFMWAYLLASLVGFGLGALLGVKIGPANVIGTFVIGPMITLGLRLINPPAAIGLRVAFLVVATLLLGAAISLVITTELGVGPVEAVMLGMIKRGLPIVASRWISDGVPLVVGLVLGGAIGVGTVVVGVALGPLIKLCLGWLHYEPRGARPGSGIAPTAIQTQG